MKIDELKRIAKENEYTIKKYDGFKVYKLVRKVGEYNVVVNSISIDADIRNLLFLNTIYCDEKDLNMIKAAVEFAETPIEDREEKTYRYEVFCEIDIKAKSKEEAIRKLEKDYGNYFSTYVGVVNEDGEVEE